MRKIQKKGNSLSLPELLDLDELQAIQDSIAKTTGISSVISSPDGEPLTRFSYPTGFCSLIQSTEEGKRRCLLSFKEMSEKAPALKKPTIMYCFAHCAHFVAPIIIGIEHKGTMFAGQFIPQRFSEEQLTEIRRIAEEINIDPELLVKEAKRMRVVEEEKVKNYSSLLFQIVGVIARLGAQSAERNRAKNKLQKAHDELELRVEERTAELAKTTEYLRREKEWAEEYLNIAGVMLAILDADEKISRINKKGCEILGYKEEELIGRNWFDTLVPQRIRGEIRGVFGKLMAGDIEPVEYYENTLLTKDGEERIIVFHNTVIRDKNSQTVGVSFSGEDITERMQAEDALRVLDARNRALVENIPDFILVVDRETTIYYANHVPPTIKREDMIGAKISDFIMPEYRDQHDEIIRQVFQSREPVEFEFLNIFGQFIYARFVPVGDMVMIIGTDITERKQAEKELEESHTFLESVIENIPDAITLKDSEHRLTLVNQAYCNSAGVTKDEVIGKTVFWENDAAIFQTGAGLYTSERTYTDIEGKRHQVSVKKAPLADESGEITHVLTISRDITERKQAEEALWKSEEKYRELINTSVDGVISSDPQMKIILWNPGAERIFGYTEKDMRGQSLIKIVPERYRKALETGFAEFRKTGSGPVIGKTLELEGLRKDGTEISIELSVSSRRVDEKYIATTMIRDITERKRAEELLRIAEADWRDSFNSMDDVMLIIDRDYNIENINEIGLKLLGKSKEEVIGQKCYQVISGADSPSEDCPCMKSLETKEVESTDRYEEVFGKFFSIKSAPIFDENGEIIKFVDLRRDITERKQAEEKVKEAYRLREHFLKETSHRIITPVAIIGGNTDLLLKSSNLDDAQKEKIRAIRKRNEEVQKLVRDALAGKYLEGEEGEG